MGSNTKYKDGSEEAKASTKRFCFYRRLVANFVGSKTFLFKQNEASSIFALINRKNEEINRELSIILKEIYANYDILDIHLILEPFELKAQTG